MTLRLLHVSDLEKAHDDPERIGRVAGLIADRRDEATLVVGTGDDFSPGVLSLRTHGEATRAFAEAVEPDAETLGNHDFDHGVEVARETIAATPQQWVCANVFEDDDSTPFAADEGLVPWTVLTAGEYRVGVVGLAHPETPSMNPKADSLTFTDPFEAAREGVAALREEGVDHVVVLSHCGRLDEELAEAVDADAILGGHVRDERVDRRDGTILSRPGADAHYLAEVTLGEDSDVRLLDVTEAPLDEAVREDYHEKVAELGLGEIVATVEDPIECGPSETKGGESRVGNFVTDAFRWAGDADVGLMSSGSVRVGPPLAGDVRAMDVVGLIPWDDDLDVVSLPGDRLLEALRELSLTYHYPEDVPEWYFGHVSGATLTWDGSDGNLVDARVGSEPLREDETYTLATSNYLVETDHLCRAFDESDRIERLDRCYDHLVEYARAVGIDPSIEGRIRTDGREPTPAEEASRGI